MSYSFGKSIVTDGLVFYVDAGNDNSYPGFGGTWSDLIGGNDGSFNNMDDINNPSNNYNSANGGSIQLDGTNENITIGNVGGNANCISVWVELPSAVTAASPAKGLLCISGNSGTTQGGIGFGSIAGAATNETIMILDGNNTIQYGRTYTRDNLSAGWNNIVINWNGTNYDFYINGSYATTYEGGFSGLDDGHVSLLPASNVVLGMGWYDNITQVFEGKFATCAIYNSSLTAAQILQNYNALKNRFI